MPEQDDHEDFRARVTAALLAFVAAETAELLAIDPVLEPVATQLVAAVADGKRLRASFCYWGWRAAGQPDSDAAVRAAAAMELVHAAAVVHDDIIDDSRLRRGAPTAHIALGAVCAGRPLRAGGQALAMLAGDLLMSWAGQLFTTSGLPTAYLGRARVLWATLARELVAGECLEVLRTGDRPDLANSLQVIRYKTAKYTVEHPLRIGGALAGADAPLLDAFSAYGLPLGEAFQLRDDVLGLFGDPGSTGKSNGDDIVGAKPTALLSLTWTSATAAERAVLRGLVGRRDLDDGSLDRVRAIVRSTGALRRAEAMIGERVTAALDAVARARVPAVARLALRRLADSAVDRQS